MKLIVHYSMNWTHFSSIGGIAIIFRRFQSN